GFGRPVSAEAGGLAVAELPRRKDLVRRARVVRVKLKQGEREAEREGAAVLAGRVLLSRQSMPPRLRPNKPGLRKGARRRTAYPPACLQSWANRIRWSSC
ncbi:MAG: hypothetical protein ACREIC_31385, partial [Limisphaerales bacterium]